MTGKQIRLGRLIKDSQGLIVVPLDHGVTVGPIHGLTHIAETVRQVTEGGADAVIVHKGLVKTIAPVLANKSELIIHLSASTTLSPEPNRKSLISSVEQALRLGATGVSVQVNLGTPSENEMLFHLGMVAEQCDLWGLPLLAMMYVRDGSEDSEYNTEKVKHAARVAEELGADIIKVNYTGSVDSFKEVTSSVRVPIVIAGGPKQNSKEDFLKMVSAASQAGAKGVAIGRNVFQDPNPQELTRALRDVFNPLLSQPS
ncbi:class I fructose-bisphosphate aldolase family protein [Heliobacterium chlorum]|uniref:2-amino-3,7-dideoxy-D-threo-hept-6-ulosonate synthase n=1 Tax=Heliobacterium chlorum TaxID=2698 RepID=A0ABR7T0E2_HELCL|nr:2-amino-3,7-dideoxy-D-threo-hept-6-ulosonate synthase [Heliobacterium chlorum]MBC9783750.1 class I fructose-bisphosphate aldolase family protein [Heliobacterium chlorum]